MIIYLILMHFLTAVHAQSFYTLRASVEEARKQNPSIQQSREKIYDAQTQLPIARANLLPVIELDGNANYQKDAANGLNVPFNGDPYNTYSMGLKLTQPILAFGTFSAVGLQDKELAIAKLNVDLAQRGLDSQIIQAYYQIVYNQRFLTSLLRQDKILREALATAERRVRSGRSQLLDALQSRTQVALQVGKIAQARNQLEISIAQLANLMGHPQVGQITIVESLEAPRLNLIDKETHLEDYHLPELDINSLQQEEIADRRRIALGPHLPHIAVVGNYGYSTYKKSDIIDDTSKQWSVMLQLTIPLFSGASSIYQLKDLASQKVQLEMNKNNTKNQLALQQISSRKLLETAEASIQTGEAALKLAEASSNEATRNFRLATIDFINFLTVQQSYVDAESVLNQYKFNYITALVNYYTASGQPLDHLIDILESSAK